MSDRPVKLLVEDILEAIGKIEDYTASLQKTDFLNDEKSIDAVVRNLEIIGEAANRLPKDFKEQNINIEWRKIVGLRHRIVHNYIGIDAEIIWQIIQVDLPSFKSKLQEVNQNL
jgi:uncharacterized protein with HEPN domain